MKKIKIIIRVIFPVMLFFISASFAHAQIDDTNSRSITSTDFQAQRPKNSEKNSASMKMTVTTSTNVKRKKNIAVVTNPKRRYNLVKKIPNKVSVAVTTNKTNPNKTTVTTKQNNQKTLKTEELGVTFWRLRPKSADDDDAPIFSVKINNQAEDWTAERVGSTTKFRKGDRVRFTIESSRTGYLYIANREIYADGTTGQAEIIFPTLRTRGGDNRVTAGSLIEIPASTDSVPYFTVKPRRADYAGEELLVVITPEKLSGIEIGLRAQAISLEMLQKWMEDWSAEVEIFDAEDGEGVAYTTNEAQAANSQSRALTQEEPLPQTIYRVRINADLPLVVPFQMQAQVP
ncbi:MAG: DUF4384 domain-containing protein [Pyrinomonadaceae bacterium]